jgi:hypothetical protein
MLKLPNEGTNGYTKYVMARTATGRDKPGTLFYNTRHSILTAVSRQMLKLQRLLFRHTIRGQFGLADGFILLTPGHCVVEVRMAHNESY